MSVEVTRQGFNMAFNFVAENEHARLSVKRHSLKSIADFEIEFKQGMTCLRRCKELSKELFDKLMLHLKDYMMKAKLYTEIEYDFFNRDGSVDKKTATYQSCRSLLYLYFGNSHQFYNTYMNVLIQRYRQFSCVPQVKVTKVKWIGISVFCSPKYDKRGKFIKFKPIVHMIVPIRSQLNNPRYREKLNQRHPHHHHSRFTLPFLT